MTRRPRAGQEGLGILSAGCDGAYLDKLDACESFSVD